MEGIQIDPGEVRHVCGFQGKPIETDFSFGGGEENQTGKTKPKREGGGSKTNTDAWVSSFLELNTLKARDPIFLLETLAVHITCWFLAPVTTFPQQWRYFFETRCAHPEFTGGTCRFPDTQNANPFCGGLATCQYFLGTPCYIAGE